jgi:NitT/TauT family transport system permease protein
VRFVKEHYPKVLVFAAFLLAWQLAVTVFGVKQFIIPSPASTFQRLFDPAIAPKYHWMRHLEATGKEVLVAFAATAVFGIGLAILITWSGALRRVIVPVLTLFNSLPKIALAPLFLLWFGYGIVPNTLIAILIAFFPVIINTAAGLNDVDDDLLDLVRYLNGTKWQLFTKIRIPSALPYMFAGLKASATLCVVGAIVGEFIASSRGLGYAIQSAQALIDTPTMFASLVIIAALGLTLYGFVALLEKLLVRQQTEVAR